MNETERVQRQSLDEWKAEYDNAKPITNIPVGDILMNINDTFPSTSNFLKKEDLPKPAKVKISDIDLMEFDQDGKKQAKLVLEFEGKEKKLACNKTNARTIAAMLGDETDNWIGKEITLYNDPTVSMGDQIVGGIRVQYTPPGMDELDDDIPF